MKYADDLFIKLKDNKMLKYFFRTLTVLLLKIHFNEAAKLFFPVANWIPRVNVSVLIFAHAKASSASTNI